nr:MAG TPA: hypothetical protein [Caudoviricetes sp.]
MCLFFLISSVFCISLSSQPISISYSLLMFN